MTLEHVSFAGGLLMRLPPLARPHLVGAAMLALLFTSSCDASDISLAYQFVKELWVILTDPNPERLLKPKPPADAGPVRSPLVEVEYNVVRYNGQELTVPGLASRWVEVLGPAVRG